MTRVLIVEDSPTQAEQIRCLLEDAGLDVEAAANGREALQVIGRRPFDLVATDLEMPEMNGLQLVEAIRQDHPALPVLLMTAHGSEEIAALALRKGAASYVPKSYLEQDLVPTLEQILAVTKADRQHRRALECLADSQAHFVLPNDTGLITPLVGYLGDVVTRLGLCDQTEVMRVGIALHEALINAVEHGNLEVSSELRQQDELHYEDMLRTRRQQPPYRDRCVHLTARLSPAEAAFVVRDEGPGFNPSVLADPTDPANLERIGGRGLLLIRTFMDEVYHNRAGNEVTLIKRREQSGVSGQ
jgi:CheY-like chemotaxis protein/anti-sigma regulatory factor (Ser/Thr protein kinase)